MDIELISLTKRYGDTVAVDGINLKIRSGSYCCLLGPSGCGKTTTLRMIAGHETVSSGDVVIGPKAVGDLPPAQRGTAMMFQSYALFPHLTCRDNVAFGLKMRGVAKAERAKRADAMLALVQMDHLAGACRRSSRAGSSSASRSPAPSSPARRCCSSTSRSRPSIRSCGCGCGPS